MRRLLAAVLLGLGLGVLRTAAAVEVSPIYEARLLGGETFYSGQRRSLAADASALAAPAMKLDERWSLLPSLSSSYQGTEQVLDIVGAGTLFEHQWDNRAAVRAIYAPPDSRWRIKPGASFKYEMLQQTADEALGNGLYDYMMYSAGVDFEYVVQEPFGLRFGLDYSGVHFPNYTSLESQAATQFQGQSLARELVGDHVLDTQNVLLTVSADGPLPDRLILEGTGSFLYQRYPNQHVVAPSGDLSQPLREDLITSLAGSLKAPRRLDDGLRLLGALDAAVSYDSSNQNSFDATQIHYLPYYYNFGELRVGPSVKIMAGPEDKAVVLSMGFTYWYRRYPYRPTQDPSSGVYNPGSPTHTHDWMFSSSLSYPMAPHFGMLLAFQFGRAESNQTFQQFYRYDYDTANYLIGFSYDL